MIKGESSPFSFDFGSLSKTKKPIKLINQNRFMINELDFYG